MHLHCSNLLFRVPPPFFNAVGQHQSCAVTRGVLHTQRGLVCVKNVSLREILSYLFLWSFAATNSKLAYKLHTSYKQTEQRRNYAVFQTALTNLSNVEFVGAVSCCFLVVCSWPLLLIAKKCCTSTSCPWSGIRWGKAYETNSLKSALGKKKVEKSSWEVARSR